jgi:hypothetical protein
MLLSERRFFQFEIPLQSEQLQSTPLKQPLLIFLIFFTIKSKADNPLDSKFTGEDPFSF